ncbi:hypothetical protein ACFSQU_07275 [Massilia sp. GCM10020059]|uniref:Uncharacterized protein n=1 Tax=Massilia agrisoli TaxID=2892444 RepID=A0ABS8IWI0_9BURK|nr:hypothetical protein [Massilia agrisoli]MCC6072236.1 hypothetical protein [Massilia agrisoli]
MNEKLHELLSRMSALEDELAIALHDQESRMFFKIRGKRIEFDSAVRQEHQRLKTGFFHWLTASRPQNLLTGPIIYAMIFPLALIDLSISCYQALCFPIYRIAKVRRADYIVLDRQYLDYLNRFEKFHCTYCAYAAGLIAYCTEIVARTEQYFCPIKHARKMLGNHARYAQFLDYGDALDYEARLEQFRLALAKKE